MCADQPREFRIDSADLLLRFVQVADEVETVFRRVVAVADFAGDDRRRGQMLDAALDAVVPVDQHSSPI